MTEKAFNFYNTNSDKQVEIEMTHELKLCKFQIYLSLSQAKPISPTSLSQIPQSSNPKPKSPFAIYIFLSAPKM